MLSQAKIRMSILLLLMLIIAYTELVNELCTFGLIHIFIGKSYTPVLHCIKSNESASYNKILIIKKLESLISQVHFWNKTLHVSDSSSVHHQEFFSIHTAMVYDV